METMFFPHSIVIIGVSDSPSNVARGIIENLDRFTFKKPVYLVGSKSGSVMGRDIFVGLSELPEVPDMAIILVPAPGLPKILESCGKYGIHRIVIESGGFSEFGEERENLEKEIIKIAARWDMKIIGPNCVGIVNVENGLVLPFYHLYPHETKKGSISIISQSGGLIHDCLALCHMANLGINKLVSIGNKLVLDENDILEYFISDPATQIIGMYLENICDGRRLMDLAAGTAKPIVLLKSNRSADSMEIARFHTSALAGDDRVVDEAMKHAGVHRVENLREMIDAFKAFSLKPLSGLRLAVITRSGGHAVLSADSVYRHGFKLASYSENFFNMLSEKIRIGIIRRTNPLDLGDVYDLEIHLEITENALLEDGVDGALFIHSYAIYHESESTKKFIASVAQLSKKNNKPVIFCMLGHKEEWFTMREVSDLPVFMHVDEALAAMQHSYIHYTDRVDANGDHIKHNSASTRLHTGIVPPGDAFDLIRKYDLDVAEYQVVESMEEGLKAASAIGYPLSVKVASPYILHKTEEAAVFLNIGNKKALKKIFQNKKADLYLIQKMIPSGCEIIIGGRRDPEFGSVILCGLGGIFVEVYKDVALRIAPINKKVAGEMIDELKGAVILRGFRGQEPYDIEYLTSTLVKVSRLLMEHNEIGLLNINPLILQPEGNGGIIVDIKLQAQ